MNAISIVPDAAVSPAGERGAGAGTRGLAASPWIMSAPFDMLFCCGGLLWILFALHYFVIAPYGGSRLIETTALVSLLGTHLFAETHIAATLFRVYRTAETRRRHATYTHWLALAAGAMILAGLFVEGLTALMLKIYLLWVVQHFTAQTYGIALIYCARRNYILSPWERGSLRALMNATVLFAVARQLTYKQWGSDEFLGQKMPFWGPLPEWVMAVSVAALLLAGVTFAFVVARKWRVERRLLPLPAFLTVATGVLIFLLNKDATGILWLYAPALYHGSQYVALTAACHRQESCCEAAGLDGGSAAVTGGSAGMRYFGQLLLIAMAVFIGIPRILEQVGFDYMLAVATIFAVVNMHHFLTDQAIWKLRDPSVRRLVTGRAVTTA